MASNEAGSEDEFSPPIKRFRKARSKEEEQDTLQKAIPKATLYKNNWGVNIFKEWRNRRENKIAILEATS